MSTRPLDRSRSSASRLGSKTWPLNSANGISAIGSSRDANGKLVVRMVAARYGFYPQRIDIPQGEEFTLRVVSFDVLHGIYVPGTNLNLMIVPGYVSQVTTQLNTLGEVPYVCHEFCGPAHAYMYGVFNVVPKNDFTLAAASTGDNG